MIKQHTKCYRQYFCAFVKKVISTKNREERGTYSDNYVYDPFSGFFDRIVYTDKAHVDLTSQA
jgi:hypothetical protein